MLELAQSGTVPEWTLGDHLRKAREHAKLTQTELATEIGISRRSLSSYESDTTEPGRPVLIAWALRTGVPYSWLRDGVDPASSQDSDGFRTARSFTTRRDMGLAA